MFLDTEGYFFNVNTKVLYKVYQCFNSCAFYKINLIETRKFLAKFTLFTHILKNKKKYCIQSYPHE